MQCTVDGCSIERYENNDQCIFHCEKTQQNGWIEKFYQFSNDENREHENKKSKWSRDRVELFWEEFSQHILISSSVEMELENYIFPIYWITQYEHENICNVLSVKKILFSNCHFLDYFNFEEVHNEDCIVSSSLVFRSCTFEDQLIIRAKEFQSYFALLYTIHKNDVVISGNFKDFFEITRTTNDHKIVLSSCKVEDTCEIALNESENLYIAIDGGTYNKLLLKGNDTSLLRIYNGTFNKLQIENSDSQELDIEDNDFIEGSRILFENLTVDKLYISELTQDSKFIRFDHINVKKELDLSKSEFKNTYFNDFDIRDANDVKLEKVSFLNAHLNSFNWGNISRIKAPKDIFRQLKYVNDGQGNNIEANNFYVMEMKSHKEELSKKEIFSPFWQDKFVFFLNQLISDFGRSWMLPLIWFVIVSTVFVFGIKLSNKGLPSLNLMDGVFVGMVALVTLLISFFIKDMFEKKLKFVWIYFLEFSIIFAYLLYGYQMSLEPFNDFAKFISPKIIKEYEKYYFLWFLHKAISGFIIYHFVLALRRQTRR